MARASELYLAMTEHLGITNNDEYRYWQDMQARAFTLLRREYEAVRALAGYVFREDPDTLARFPSLVSASRKPRRRAGSSDTPQLAPVASEPARVEEVA